MPTKKLAPVIRDASSQFQRETRNLALDTNSGIFQNGILLTGVVLATTTTRVPHRLGRPYRGFVVVDRTVSGDVWRDSSDTNRIQDAIPLVASGAMTISLWVF
jgi:hypothetical protein